MRFLGSQSGHIDHQTRLTRDQEGSMLVFGSDDVGPWRLDPRTTQEITSPPVHPVTVEVSSTGLRTPCGDDETSPRSVAVVVKAGPLSYTVINSKTGFLVKLRFPGD